MAKKVNPDRFEFVSANNAREAAKLLIAATGDQWVVRMDRSFDAEKPWSIVRQKTVKNLMSGNEVVIDADTPFVCDPSTETYWSM